MRFALSVLSTFKRVRAKSSPILIAICSASKRTNIIEKISQSSRTAYDLGVPKIRVLSAHGNLVRNHLFLKNKAPTGNRDNYHPTFNQIQTPNPTRFCRRAIPSSSVPEEDSAWTFALLAVALYPIPHVHSKAYSRK